jgi:hypothetical protein
VTVFQHYTSKIASSFISARGMGNEMVDCSKSSYIASPYDCHSFYRCFNDVSPPIKMSCGFLMFNPIHNTCDWPSNAIRMRPECGSTFSYFSRLPSHRKTTTTTTIGPIISFDPEIQVEVDPPMKVFGEENGGKGPRMLMDTSGYEHVH